jgi:RND family efflux transporter MFP subunit
MQRKWVVAAGVVVVAAVGLGAGVLSGAIPLGGAQSRTAGQAQAKKAEPALQFATREVARPELAAMPARIEFSGPLVAPGTAVLKARAGGTLLSLAVAEGARVRAGQVLGRIELADVSSRVAERDANVAAARATLAQAERTHAQNQRLASQQFISPAALDASRSALETAQAQLDAALASADMARVGLRDATLVAPISGIVARRHVLPGEKVGPGQQVLTIVDLQQLELAGNVGAHEVARLSPGMPVAVQVEGSDRPVAGRIARIAPAAEPGTRSIGVTIELPNPKETLRAGQYAVASATLDDPTQRLTVPATAVGQTSGQDHVWVIENGALARRAIMVGRRDAREGRVEVLQGLDANSVVLAARFENLREGAKAVVVAEKSAASAAASHPIVK